MEYVTEMPEEVIKVRVTHYQRIPGKGRGGHLSSGETKVIALTETTLDEVYEIVVGAIHSAIMSQGITQQNFTSVGGR